MGCEAAAVRVSHVPLTCHLDGWCVPVVGPAVLYLLPGPSSASLTPGPGVCT